MKEYRIIYTDVHYPISYWGQYRTEVAIETAEGCFNKDNNLHKLLSAFAREFSENPRAKEIRIVALLHPDITWVKRAIHSFSHYYFNNGRSLEAYVYNFKLQVRDVPKFKDV